MPIQMIIDIIGSLKRGIAVGDYPTDQLLGILIRMKGLFNFCDCSLDYEDRVDHKCKVFGVHNDIVHTPLCGCCQRIQFLDMLGVFMDQLSQENRLSSFYDNHLSRARIRNRTFNLKFEGSKLYFQILRHLYAFRRSCPGERITQSYTFDFKTLALEKLK
jgi:hypothetical protein